MSKLAALKQDIFWVAGLRFSSGGPPAQVVFLTLLVGGNSIYWLLGFAFDRFVLEAGKWCPGCGMIEIPTSRVKASKRQRIGGADDTLWDGDRA